MASDASEGIARRILDGRLLEADGDGMRTRAEIVASWRRSAEAGLDPDRFDVPYHDTVDSEERVRRAAGPVFDRLADELARTQVSVLFTDGRGAVLDRRVADHGLRARLDAIRLAEGFGYSEREVGTNAIGAAAAEHAPVVVLGGEHFAAALRGMACVAVPVTDPRTGRVAGIVDLTSAAAAANDLMLPLARMAAHDIESQLLEHASAGERALLEHFVRARRRARGPLVSINAHDVLPNAAAAAFVESADHGLLWDTVTRVLADNGRGPAVITLARGASVSVSCEPVRNGTEVVGALVRLEPAASGPAAEPVRRGRRADRAAFGWESLTEAELGVTTVVADGLTNQEAGARLFMSRHTVDAHLRRIFRKLDISSRVELARIVAQRRADEDADQLPAQ